MKKIKLPQSYTAPVRIIILVIVVFLILIVTSSLYVFYNSTHPEKIVSQETPLKYGDNYGDVEFKSDNLILKGWFISANNFTTNKVIIALHGYPFDKGDILNQTLFLLKDYNLLLFDFRYFGFSEGKYTTLGFKEH